jgi:large subunit ribosomal protein L33
VFGRRTEGPRDAGHCPAAECYQWINIMREYVWLECTVCSARNYRTQKETRGADRLEMKKFCKKERKHTPHKETRKK